MNDYDIAFPELFPAHGFPLPGTYIGTEIVVASVHYNEDESANALTALVITLDPERPGEFYRVALIEALTPHAVIWEERFPNIVPTVAAYEQNGGDW